MVDGAFNVVALCFNDGIIGHGCIFPMGGRKAEMLIVVHPAFRNRGIGSQLTQCLIHSAFESDLDKIWLTVEAANHIARHIYHKCGFAYLVTGQVDEVEMILDVSRYRLRTRTRIGEIMNTKVISIDRRASCEEAIDLFVKCPVGSLPVVDEQNTIVGIVTETDLIMEVSLSQSVGAIMTHEVMTVREEWPVAKAIRLFQSKRVRMFPVIDKAAKLVGIVGRKDILAYYYRSLLNSSRPSCS
jgi:CBS domain-containing protein